MDRPLSVRREVRLLSAFWFLRDFQLWIPVWIVFLTLERGFSLTQVTIAESVYLVAIIAFEVPTGAVADRFGRTRSLTLGAGALGAAVLTFAFATTFPVLLVSFLVWSLAHALMSGADMALLFDTLKAAGREDAYERTAGRGAAFSWSGAGLGTLLGGPVAALIDVRATILIGAATCVLAAGVALAMREAPHVKEAARTNVGSTIRTAFAEVWRLPDVRIAILLSGVAFAALDATGYLVQPYLVDRRFEVGVLFSLLQVPVMMAGIGGSLLAGPISKRLGAPRALILVPTLGAAFYALLVVSPGRSALAAIPLLVVLCSTMPPTISGYVNRRVSSERRATVLSMQGMVGSLAGAAIVPTLGFATDNRGIGLAFSICGLVALVPVLALGPAFLRKGPEQFSADTSPT